MAENTPDLDSLFLAALEIATPEARAAFLDQSCGENRELRTELDRMLVSHGELGSFLEQPAAEFEATIVPAAGQDLADVLQAGLAAAFRENQSVVIGDAGHSVLQAIGQTLNKVPRVVLRDAAGGHDPVVRPKSAEMPKGNSDSRYRLDGEIARGGMGAIIKGRDTDLGRDLAIKVLLDQHKDKPEVIQRFVEEAQIGGQLQHPGIAPIYELGQFADKRPFFAMKLVKGETLSKLLADREAPTAERGKFLGIFEQVCQTMAYAHSRGVIHRDLKPANIMVGAFGEVQVMDWGLAKVLSAGGIADEKKAHDKQQGQSIIQTLRSQPGSDAPGTFGTLGSQTLMGSVMGTPAYMPPEQALGEIDRLDERSDVFGLGAILCEILTGKPPYVGENGTQVYRMASRGKLDGAFERLNSCGADEDLIALARHCLELEPANRPRNAEALAERVTGYLESVETKLRETEMERATQAARADAESLQAEAEHQRAEAETRRAEAEGQRAQSQSQAARRLRVIVASLALIAVLCGITAVQFQRSGQQQRQMAQRQNEDRAQALVESLLNAELNRVPAILEQMEVERKWVDPLLASSAQERAGDDQAQRRLAMTLRILDRDVDILLEWLLVAEIEDLNIVRDILRNQKEQVALPLWNVALDAQQSDEKRLRAAASLALYDPMHADWQQLGPYTADRILEEPLLLLDKWATLLQPVHSSLLANLAAAFRNPAADQRLRRDKATVLLGKQFDAEPDVLVDLLLDADVEQFEPVLKPLRRHRDSAIQLLEAALEQDVDATKTTDEFVRLASRRANAATALARLGETQRVWQMLRESPRPDTRSFLIARLGPYGVDPKLIVDRLSVETDVSIRRALIQSLGEFPLDATDPLRVEVTQSLLNSYRADPDPGLHGSAGWLLRRWGYQADVQKINAEPGSHEISDGRRWYVDAGGRTMVILPPATFPMGQPAEDGAVHERYVDRAFAISDVVSEGQNSWIEMARLCIDMSRAEGIPQDQWCFGPNGLAPDYLRRTGYRMPTEAEWEYACRAGTATSRYFGEADSLVDHYAWCRASSPDDDKHPVALLKPNDFGLFDMLGNQRNTCVGHFGEHRSPQGLALWDVEISTLQITHNDTQPCRGRSYNQSPARAYDRDRQDEIYSTPGHGLRVVRTLPLQMCQAAFGNSHPAMLGALYNEAILAVGNGDTARADELDRQLLDHATEAVGKDPELWQTAMRFATRLAARRDQQNIARERCDQLLTDPMLTSSHDLSLVELRLTLNPNTRAHPSTWAVLQPPETEATLKHLPDGSLQLTPGPHTILLPDAGEALREVRIETSGQNAPAYTEYRILSTGLPARGFRGQYVLLDLPGDNSQYPRSVSDPDDNGRKFINLAELQVFQGEQNIALKKNAQSSSGGNDRLTHYLDPVGIDSILDLGSDRIGAENGVDGNTRGDLYELLDGGNPFVHTLDTEPWFEVDLGSEQTFDRIVIWNRSDTPFFKRMNHFRIRILDANFRLMFERVIDQPPSPSLEIRRQIEFVKANPETAEKNGNTWQLSFDNQSTSEPWQRIRIAGNTQSLSMLQDRNFATARNISPAIGKLIDFYFQVGNQSALDSLANQLPRVAVVLADLNASQKNWEPAIAAYSRLITPATNDVALLIKRATAYVATEQRELAKADLSRVAQHIPKGLPKYLGLELANLLLIVGDQSALSRLFEQHPATVFGLAERMVIEKDWERVISLYNLASTPETTDSTLLAKRAEAYVATEQWELAKADLQRALEHCSEGDAANLAAQLLELILPSRASEWTVIKPTEMTSAGGATLTLQDDGSILANGKNPDQDAYQITAKIPPQRITAIRLEAIPDASLPGNGPGRWPGHGNFHLNEFRVLINGMPQQPAGVTVSFADPSVNEQYRKIIDGTIDGNHWGIYPKTGQRHSAIFATDLELGPDDELTFELISSRGQFPLHNLGRFRLSVTDDSKAFEDDLLMKLIAIEQQRLDVYTDPWLQLAAAYNIVNDQSAISRLLARHPNVSVRLAELLAANQKWEQAVAWYNHAIEMQDRLDMVVVNELVNGTQSLNDGAASTQAKITFVNNLQSAVEVFWDRGAQTLAYLTLPSEELLTLQTHPWHIWIIRDLKTKHELAKFTAVNAHVTLEITDDKLRVAHLLTKRAVMYEKLQQRGLALADWERAIADYNQAITSETTDATLLARRAAAYVATEQWELAEPDWQRVTKLQPHRLRTAYDMFRKSGRWTEAERFGQKLFEQDPQDRRLWLELAPLLVLANEEDAYRDFCQRLTTQFGATTDATEATYLTKACLLLPGMVDVAKLPADAWVKPLEDGTAEGKGDPLRWGLRGLLALRGGKPELASEYIGQSEKLSSWGPSRAFNQPVLAMAHHELKHPDEARAALAEASKLITELRKQPDSKVSPDLLICEILFREAEALINGKATPESSRTEEK